MSILVDSFPMWTHQNRLQLLSILLFMALIASVTAQQIDVVGNTGGLQQLQQISGFNSPILQQKLPVHSHQKSSSVEVFSQSQQTPPLSIPPTIGAARRQHLNLYVGSLFTWDLTQMGPGTAPNPAQFPRWCRFNQSSGEIYGIPQFPEDLGTHRIRLDTDPGFVLEITVLEESETGCGEASTLWIDVFDGKRFTNVPIPEQYKSLKQLIALLREQKISASEFGQSQWRVFPASYLQGRFRTVQAVLSEDAFPQHWNSSTTNFTGTHFDPLVFTLQVACGELNDLANDAINALADSQLPIAVVEGHLKALHQTKTTPEATTGGGAMVRHPAAIQANPSLFSPSPINNNSSQIRPIKEESSASPSPPQISFANNNNIFPYRKKSTTMSTMLNTISSSQQSFKAGGNKNNDFGGFKQRRPSISTTTTTGKPPKPSSPSRRWLSAPSVLLAFLLLGTLLFSIVVFILLRLFSGERRYKLNAFYMPFGTFYGGGNRHRPFQASINKRVGQSGGSGRSSTGNSYNNRSPTRNLLQNSRKFETNGSLSTVVTPLTADELPFILSPSCSPDSGGGGNIQTLVSNNSNQQEDPGNNIIESVLLLQTSPLMVTQKQKQQNERKGDSPKGGSNNGGCCPFPTSPLLNNANNNVKNNGTGPVVELASLPTGGYRHRPPLILQLAGNNENGEQNKTAPAPTYDLMDIARLEASRSNTTKSNQRRSIQTVNTAGGGRGLAPLAPIEISMA